MCTDFDFLRKPYLMRMLVASGYYRTCFYYGFVCAGSVPRTGILFRLGNDNPAGADSTPPNSRLACLRGTGN